MSKIHWNENINCLLIEGKNRYKNFKNPKTFIDDSQKNDDVYENLKDYNPTKKRKTLLVFDNIIADMKLIKK